MITSNSLRLRKLTLAGVLALLTAHAALAAEPAKPAAKKKYVAPRTEFGAPDLRGVWNFSSNTPLERPAQFAGREFLTPEEAAKLNEAAQARFDAAEAAESGESSRGGVGGYNQFWVESLAQGTNQRTSLIIDPPDGKLPALLPGIKAENGGLGPDTGGKRPVRFRVGGVAKNGPEDRGLSERCLMGFNSGPPFVPSLYNNNVQIFLTRTHAVLMTEMIHDARVVPLDKRPPLDPAIRQWSGDSRGYWEGETLVVETRSFTDKTNTFRGAGTGATMQLTERLTRVGPDRVDYQFTINDPATYTKPFTVLVPMVRADGELFEYACHEGNYGMANILSGARQEELEAGKRSSGGAP
jgi:hypothetical protein